MHTFPPPESVGYAGTVSYLYYIFVAAVYFVFGRHWLLVKVIVALLSALSVPAAAAIGDSLSGRRLGVAAAWLAALYPNAVFWGATGLKDGPFATLLLAAAAIALRPPAMRRVAGAVVIIAVAFLSRPVVGICALAMLVVSAMERGRRRVTGNAVRTRARLHVLLVGVPVLVTVSVFLGARYLPAVQGQRPGPGMISYSVSAREILRALLGPFPWEFGPASDSVYRALYPGMVVWIVMLPAVALGCWELIRRGSWTARSVVASALAFLYLYAAVFQNEGFFRQRYTVEILLLVVALYAFDRFPRRAAVWTAIGGCVVAPAALVQAKVLPPAALAFPLIVGGALWLAGTRMATPRVRRSSPRPVGSDQRREPLPEQPDLG